MAIEGGETYTPETRPQDLFLTLMQEIRREEKHSGYWVGDGCISVLGRDDEIPFAMKIQLPKYLEFAGAMATVYLYDFDDPDDFDTPAVGLLRWEGGVSENLQQLPVRYGAGLVDIPKSTGSSPVHKIAYADRAIRKRYPFKDDNATLVDIESLKAYVQACKNLRRYPLLGRAVTRLGSHFKHAA